MSPPDFALDDLMTVKAVVRRYPDLFESESRLRYLLRHRKA